MISTFTVPDTSFIASGSILSKMKNFPGATWVILAPEDGDKEGHHLLVPLSKSGVERVPNTKTKIEVPHQTFDQLIERGIFVAVETEDNEPENTTTD